MKRIRFAAAACGLLLTAVLTLVGCGGNNDSGEQTGAAPSPSSTIDRSKIITIRGKQVAEDGRPYTCGVVIDAENDVCLDDYQVAFNKWGDNIPAYVDSGKLGPLGDDSRDDAVMRYQDVAASGLAACIMIARDGLSTDGSGKFVKWLKESYPEQEGIALLPFYFEAPKSLCKDVGNRTTGDRVTP